MFFVFFVIAQWTLPKIILIRDIDMFSTYVPISANCLFVYCLLHLCIRMFIVFLCNINHCNDSAPGWDLDWTIKILSYLIYTIYTPLNTCLMYVPRFVLLDKVRRVWRYQRGNHNPYIEEEQTTQWPKEKVQKDKQRSTNIHIKLKIE